MPACLHAAPVQIAGNIPVGRDPVHHFGRVFGRIEQLLPPAVCKVNILPIAASDHDFEPVGPGFTVIPEQGLPGWSTPIEGTEHIHPVTHLDLAGGAGGDAKEIGQADQILAEDVPRQTVGPAYQEGHPRGDVEETLLLPRGMIPEVVAVIREETDEGVVGVLTSLDGVQNPSQAIVYVGDLSVVAGLEHPGRRIVYFVRPDDPVHERYLLVQVVHRRVAADRTGHAVGIVYAVEGHGRREGRMGTDEGHETEIWPVIGRAQRFDRAVRRPRFNGQVGGKRADLGHVVHFGPLPHERFDIVELRMFPGDPSCVGLIAPLFRTAVKLFAVELGFVPHVFVPRGRVELAHAEGSVTHRRQGTGQIVPATAFKRTGLARNRRGPAVAENPGRGRIATRADGCPRRHADRAGRIALGKRHAAAHEAVHVGGVYVPVAQRGDGVEALLVRHDEEYVGTGHRISSAGPAAPGDTPRPMDVIQMPGGPVAICARPRPASRRSGTRIG